MDWTYPATDPGSRATGIAEIAERLVRGDRDGVRLAAAAAAGG